MTLEELICERIKQATTLDELAFILQKLFEQHSIWTDGRLISIRALVGNANGLKIEIYPREHPPAHFHVRSVGVNATFTVEDCKYLEGKISRREQDLVEFWYKHSRPLLIKKWNELRPSDCQVGPIIQ